MPLNTYRLRETISNSRDKDDDVDKVALARPLEKVCKKDYQ